MWVLWGRMEQILYIAASRNADGSVWTDERSVRRIRQEARSFQEDVEASVAELAASDRTLAGRAY